MLGNKWYLNDVIQAQAPPQMNTNSMFTYAMWLVAFIYYYGAYPSSPHTFYSRFLKRAENLNGQQLLSFTIMLWLRLKPHPDWLPYPPESCTKCLIIFIYCWWACGCIINPIPPHLLAHIWNVSWNSLSLMVYEWYYHAVIDAQALLNSSPHPP